MSKYDMTDEAIINAPPGIVFGALISEYDGKSHWWMPYVSSKPRSSGQSLTKIGSLFDLTIYGKPPMKITAKSSEIKVNESIRLEYIDGALRGEGLWKLEDLGEKTKCIFRFQVRTSGFLTGILAPFLPIKKFHSNIMKAGFQNLNVFVT